MAQFIKDMQYKIERKITKKENFAANLQGKTETLVAVCINKTACYATFAIKGKENIRRATWTDENGNECINYLKEPGCSKDCISAANMTAGVDQAPAAREKELAETKLKGRQEPLTEAEMKQGEAIAKFCYDHKKPVIREVPEHPTWKAAPDEQEAPEATTTDGGVFTKGQSYKLVVGINQDEKIIDILDRTDKFAKISISGIGNTKIIDIMIRQHSQGEFITLPGSRYGNDIIKAEKEVKVDKFELQKEGSEALETPAVEVETGKNVTELIDAMFNICNEGGAIGLAANQAGARERIIVINTGGRKVAIINPVITRKHGGCNTKKEGCLSYPGRKMRVKRAKRVDVVGYDSDWNEIELKLSGMPARVVQHGLDRLAGRAF